MNEALSTPDSVQRTFYRTRALTVAVQSLDRIYEERIIGIVVANPGVGKTEAINYWRKKHASVRHAWIEAKVFTAPRVILNSLMDALGISAGRNMHESAEFISAALSKNPMLFIIDEADLLTVRTFEVLRSLWDRTSQLSGDPGESAFPLALFGVPRLRTMLEREDLERLRSRVYHSAELPPLNRDELATVIKKWNVRVDDEAIDELLQRSKGSFRWVNNLMKIAIRLASRNGQVVTGKIICNTEKYIIRLPE